jgi:hypothetical protein
MPNEKKLSPEKVKEIKTDRDKIVQNNSIVKKNENHAPRPPKR